MVRRVALLSLWLAACGGDPDLDGGVDASSGADSGSEPSDAGAMDAGDVDAGDVDAGGIDSGAVDASAVDASANDGGTADVDAGADAGFDGGPPTPTTCATDAECGSASCLAGVCRSMTETTYADVGLASITRMVVGADLDGTLRLLTDTGASTYDVVGLPGAFAIMAGGVATDRYPLRSGGREETAVSHASYTNGDYRWVIVDQAAGVNEDRPINFQTTTHARDGSTYVLTLPQYPRGPSDFIEVYPLRLWSPAAGGGYDYEDLIRTVGTRRDFHLRVDATGQVQVMETDAFRVFRWHLELAGWERTLVHTFSPVATRDGTSRWLNDAAGHTHLVRILPVGASTDALTYVEMDDAGEVRSMALTFGDQHVLASQLGFDDAGDIYFLSLGLPTSPDRRPYYLHRVLAGGGDERTLLGTLRTDRSEALALAVQPDGDLYVFVYSPTRDLVVRELAIAP